MSHFHPQRVPASSCLFWFKEALALSASKPLLFIVFVGAYTALPYLPIENTLWLSCLMIACSAPLVGVMCILAEAIDTGRQPIDLLKSKSVLVWCGVMLLVLLPIGLHYAFDWIQESVSGVVTTAEPKSRSLMLQTTNGAGVATLAIAVFYQITGPWTLMALPLVVNGGLSFTHALGQSFLCLVINWFLLVLFFAIIAITWLLLFVSEVLIYPWIAIVGCVQYVAYRHIWLGRKENQHQPAKASTAAPVVG